MTTRKPTTQILLFVVGLALLAGACASGETNGTALSSPATTTTIPAPATTSPPQTTTPPMTTEVPAAETDSTPPHEDVSQPLGDCRRSIEMATIHYQLAFFSQCLTEHNSAPFPVYRRLENPLSLQEKLQSLVAGAKFGEAQDGLFSGFDSVAERNEIEVAVDVDAQGIATVDFLIAGERWNPGARASASAQYASFVEPLEATVFSDPDVTGLNRSTLCWGESDCTGVTTRETWEGILFVNYGVLCDLEHHALDGWGCRANDAATYTAAVVGVAANDVLNMRSGPGVAYFKVGALDPDATVSVLQNRRLATDGALWRLVRDAAGGVGWVNASFLANHEVLTGDRSSEEQVVDAFVEFAQRPSDRSFAALPLADSVALGLGSEILRTVSATELRNASTWELELEYFRAYVGPFSALSNLFHRGDYEVTVGPHNHCASPPMPAPTGYEELTRISVQPAAESMDSCLQWSTVDFFVNADNEVAAITLDLWEP